MSAVTSCGQVKAAVTAVSLAAGTIIGATSFTSTTYNAASLHTAASTMLPQAASGFAVSHFPTSSANRTAYTALPSATQGTSCKKAGPMPSAYAQNGESTATATPDQNPPLSAAIASTRLTQEPVTN